MVEEPRKPGPERRRTPRVKATHELTLKQGDGAGAMSFQATSVDLNLGGIYCMLNAHLPLFSKMQITLQLPIADDDGDIHRFEVGVEGVVVRMDPEDYEPTTDEYACAMAFVNTDPDVELVLAKYLLQSLMQPVR